jgi:hypothetical protein
MRQLHCYDDLHYLLERCRWCPPFREPSGIFDNLAVAQAYACLASSYRERIHVECNHDSLLNGRPPSIAMALTMPKNTIQPVLSVVLTSPVPIDA